MLSGENSLSARALLWIFDFSSFTYLFFALIFPFRVKINRVRRLIPLAVLLVDFVSAILFPLDGFTDLRTVWRIYGGYALYSLCYLGVAAWLYFFQTSFSKCFSVVSVFIGLSSLAVRVWQLIECLRRF